MITRKKGNLIFEPKVVPTTGIVYFYAEWSDSELYLKYLVTMLEGFPQIDLFVYNIDKENVNDFMNVYHEKSHGFGETFWIYDGKVLAKVSNFQKEETNSIEHTQLLVKNILV